MSKAMSASTTSPGKIFSKNLNVQLSTCHLLNLPKLDINDMTPCGLTSIKIFMVLQCLYYYQVHALAM